jgi:hypothetical protein
MTPGPIRSGGGSPRWVARSSAMNSVHSSGPPAGVTFLNCGPAEAVRIGLAGAGGKNLEVSSPTIGRQLPAATAKIPARGVRGQLIPDGAGKMPETPMY